MKELNISLSIKINIARGEIKINNNLLYQLKEFMVEVYFAILKAILSALEERTTEELKDRSPR